MNVFTLHMSKEQEQLQQKAQEASEGAAKGPKKTKGKKSKKGKGKEKDTDELSETEDAAPPETADSVPTTPQDPSQAGSSVTTNPRRPSQAGGSDTSVTPSPSVTSEPGSDPLVAGLPQTDGEPDVVKRARRKSSLFGESDFRPKQVSSVVKDRWDIVDALKFAEGFSYGHSPDWTKPTVEAATYVVSDKGDPDSLPVGPNMRCMDEAVLAGIIEQFSSMPLDRIHHFALNGEFMYGLFRDKKLVDILVHVEDRMFYGHRSILAAHSNYFASILIDNDVPPYKITDVTLTNVNADYFKLFLHFAYTGDVFVTMMNLVPLKNLANALQSSTLRARLLLYMSKMALLTLKEALYILCNNILFDETPLAIEVVKMNFMNVLEDVESLVRFSLEDFEDIISANNLCVNSELDVFWAVLFWVATDPANRIQYLNRLMKEVRFTNMSSLELLDCARVSELVRLSKGCKNMLLSANWVCHARELGLQDPLGLPQQPKRLCLIDKPSHEPTVAEFDHRFLIYKTMMGQNGGNLDLDTEKLGVSFDTLDDITNFVYPGNDAPFYPEADYDDFRGMVKGFSKLPELDDSASPKGDGPGEGTKGPRKKKKGNKQKGAKKPRKTGKKTPAVSGGKPGKGKKTKRGPRRSSSNNRRLSPTSSSEGYVQSNESANRNMSSNSPVRHRYSPVRHRHSPVRRENSSAADRDPLLLWESAIPPSTQVMLSQGAVLQPLRTQKVTLSRTRVEDMCVTDKEAGHTSEATAAATDDGRPGGQDGKPRVTQDADAKEETSFLSNEIHRDATKTCVYESSQPASGQAEVCPDRTDMSQAMASQARGSPSSQKSAPAIDLMRFE